MSYPVPEITELARAHWDGLAAGELRFQHCTNCENSWLPAKERCPRCLAETVTWEVSSGKGRIISWVVYHVAYHEAFKAKLPYNVTIVELDEGPRILTNIVDTSPVGQLTIGAAVELVIEYEGEQALARFRLSEDKL